MGLTIGLALLALAAVPSIASAAGVVSTSGGGSSELITYTGDAGINDVTVDDEGADTYTFVGTDGISDTSALCNTVGTTTTCSGTSFDRVFMNMLGDNDIVNASASNDDDIDMDGGLGGDTLTASQQGAEDLAGGDGADRIDGQGGDDTITGGTGDDNVGSALSGGSGDDTITGDDGNDVLNGDAGEDTLSGGNNSDTINGGADDDDPSTGLSGGAGNDTVNGDAGNDELNGDADADTLNGSVGADDLDGGTGNDLLRGGDNGDSNDGGPSGSELDRWLPDTCDAGVGVSINLNLSGSTSQANDCQGSTSGETLVDIELLNGSENNDTLTGNCIANVLNAFGGVDTLNGDSGGCTPTNGADFIAPGAGADIVDGDGTASPGADDTVTYATNTAAQGIVSPGITLNDVADDRDGHGATTEDIHSDIDVLIGGAGDDFLNGDGVTGNSIGVLGVTLWGRDGADTLTGDEPLNDYLDGQNGADDLDCLGGFDTYHTIGDDVAIDNCENSV